VEEKSLKQIGYAILLTVIIAVSARAEPGPTVQWLMNEPATLFDLGMSKLNRLVENSIDYIFSDEVGASTDRDEAKHGEASYDYNSNRIIIQLGITRPFEKAQCLAFLNKARLELVGIGVPDLPSIISDFITHTEGNNKIGPRRIDEITVVTVVMASGYCTGPIVSSDVTFKDLKQ